MFYSVGRRPRGAKPGVGNETSQALCQSCGGRRTPFGKGNKADPPRLRRRGRPAKCSRRRTDLRNLRGGFFAGNSWKTEAPFMRRSSFPGSFRDRARARGSHGRGASGSSRRHDPRGWAVAFVGWGSARCADPVFVNPFRGGSGVRWHLYFSWEGKRIPPPKSFHRGPKKAPPV